MAKKLIIGLGNPGPKYELTRHNIGFIVLDNLALKYGIDISKKKELCLIGDAAVEGERAMLAKPQTYMNKSGSAVKRLLDYFEFELKDLIIVHDDLDLEFGQIKIKDKGGHGGHNGIRSVLELLGDDQFSRLRIGIGRPPGRMPAEKYVLSNFSESDEDLSELIERSVKALEIMIKDGNVIAMNKFH
jgi:PTH1 family peptidyl-tRNA hydrolase